MTPWSTLLLLLWLVSVVGGYFIAKRKGRSAAEGILIPVVLGIIGLAIVACLANKRKAAGQHRTGTPAGAAPGNGYLYPTQGPYPPPPPYAYPSQGAYPTQSRPVHQAPSPSPYPTQSQYPSPSLYTNPPHPSPLQAPYGSYQQMPEPSSPSAPYQQPFETYTQQPSPYPQTDS